MRPPQTRRRPTAVVVLAIAVVLMLPDFTGRYVIMEAPSMLQARMNAAVRSIAAGAPFAEGHELSARLMASVPPTQVGRMLSGAEAAELIRRLDSRRTPEK